MRHLLGRTLLGGLLCAVALTTSGCFLRLASARIDVTTIGEEVRQILNAVFANATVAVCALAWLAIAASASTRRPAPGASPATAAKVMAARIPVLPTWPPRSQVGDHS